MSDRLPTADGMPEFRTWSDRLTYLLSEYRYAVMLAVAAGVVLLATGRASTPDVPPWFKFWLQAILVGIIPATFLGKVVIVDRYLPDTRLLVGVVDLRDGVLVDIQRVQNGVWKNRNRGKWQEFQPTRGPTDYLVTSFEWSDEQKKLTVEGVNPELTDAVEMVTVEGRIEEIYETLLDDRHKLRRLMGTLHAKALEYDSQQSMAIWEAIEHGTSIAPGSIKEVFDPEAIDAELDGDGPDADDTDPRDPDPYADTGVEGLTLDETLALYRREMDEIEGRAKARLKNGRN